MRGWTLGMLVCAGFGSAVCAQEVPFPSSGQQPSTSTAWVALPVQAQVPSSALGLRPLRAASSSVPVLAPSFPLVEGGQPVGLLPALGPVSLLSPANPRGLLAPSDVVGEALPVRAVAMEMAVALGEVASVPSLGTGLRPLEATVASVPVPSPAALLAIGGRPVGLPPVVNVAALPSTAAPQGQLAPSDVGEEPRTSRALATEVSVALGETAKVHARSAENAVLSSHPASVETSIPATVGLVATLPVLVEVVRWAEVSASETTPLSVPPGVVAPSKSDVPVAASSVLAPLAPAQDTLAPSPRLALTWEQRLEPRAVQLER